MDDGTWLDATTQAELVRRREVKPEELVEAARARFDQLDPALNRLGAVRGDTRGALLPCRVAAKAYPYLNPGMGVDEVGTSMTLVDPFGDTLRLNEPAHVAGRAPTSQSALAASFRPEIELDDGTTLVRPDARPVCACQDVLMDDGLHFEPFVHLAGLDDDQVLIAWGGFWFRPFPDGRGWRTVDDEELHEVDPGRTESIGVRSEPHGDARVQVFDGDGRLAGEAATSETNHVWVTGLASATEYRYEITVDGSPWVPDSCMRWQPIDGDRGELRPAGRTYDCRFRTFPEPGAATTARFAAFGDYGIGIQTREDAGRHQRHIASVLEHLVEDPGIDFVVTLGDNIYHGEDNSAGGSGREDDDWYFSFYEPYRFVISRVPVYPSVGNHDVSETEHSDDRGQLADNHFTDLRFDASVEEDRASVEIDRKDTPGLFYRVSFGRLVELLCIDTSEATAFEVERYFDDPEHQPFLDQALDPSRADRGRWLIPFGHHPPYCAGPKHHNDEAQIRSLVPRYQDGGVRVVLSGHEHNFQHAVNDGIHYLVSGAAGKLRPGDPEEVDAAGLRSWAAEPHLLLVEADADRISILPVARLDTAGRPVPVEARAVGGGTTDMPIVITR